MKPIPPLEDVRKAITDALLDAEEPYDGEVIVYGRTEVDAYMNEMPGAANKRFRLRMAWELPELFSLSLYYRPDGVHTKKYELSMSIDQVEPMTVEMVSGSIERSLLATLCELDLYHRDNCAGCAGRTRRTA